MIPGVFARYLLRRFLLATLGLLAGLTAVLTVFDLLANAGEVLAGATVPLPALAAYTALRVPQIVSLLLPLAVLLAALATLGRLAAGSELIAIRAAGVSGVRIAGTLLLGAAVVAAVHFWFAELVVPESAGRLRLWQARDYAGLPPAVSPRYAPTWFAAGQTIVHVEASSTDGTRLMQPTLIERDAGGRLVAFTTADLARYRDGRWILTGVRRPLAIEGETTPTRLVLDLPLDPERFSVLAGGPEEVGLRQLAALAGSTEVGRRSPAYYAFWMNRKLAQPAASLVMVLIAVPLGLQLARRNRLLASALGALAAGFLFFIAERLLVPLGENGVLPAAMAAWAPVGAFGLLAFWNLLRREA